MAEQAKVTSLDALEAFRATLIVFLSDARQSLDETGDAVRRMRNWLEGEQRSHWENQIRKRKRILDEAEQALFAARLSPLREVSAKHQEDVRRGRRAVDEAEEKLRRVKKWNRDFDSAVEPLAKRLESLRHFLDHDLLKAVAYLVTVQRTLEGYAEVRADRGGSKEPPSEAAAPVESPAAEPDSSNPAS